jgi:imidazolonepropionase-like amidohydrolase
MHTNHEISSGSDSSPASLGTAVGASTHHELLLYVEYAGMKPIEALRSATSVAARRFKLADRGRVQEGCRADLILVKGDPTEQISSILDLEKVWKHGVVLG